jgi:copper homeostasis protein CutC
MIPFSSSSFFLFSPNLKYYIISYPEHGNKKYSKQMTCMMYQYIFNIRTLGHPGVTYGISPLATAKRGIDTYHHKILSPPD